MYILAAQRCNGNQTINIPSNSQFSSTRRLIMLRLHICRYSFANSIRLESLPTGLYQALSQLSHTTVQTPNSRVQMEWVVSSIVSSIGCANQRRDKCTTCPRYCDVSYMCHNDKGSDLSMAGILEESHGQSGCTKYHRLPSFTFSFPSFLSNSARFSPSLACFLHMGFFPGLSEYSHDTT